ncbi:DUF2567 domain-containing protein [Luedemannella flava]
MTFPPTGPAERHDPSDGSGDAGRAAESDAPVAPPTWGAPQDGGVAAPVAGQPDADAGQPGYPGQPGYAVQPVGYGVSGAGGYEGQAWGTGGDGRWVATAPASDSTPLADVLVGVLTGVVVAAFGAPLGWLWAALAPRIPIVRVDGGFTYADAEPEQVIAADGWFMLLGAGAGILLAVIVWLALRRWRGPVLLAGLVLGSLGSAWLAWYVGRHIGLAEFERLREARPWGRGCSRRWACGPRTSRPPIRGRRS